MIIDYQTGKTSKPIKVSDPSQPWKIGIALVFGGWFVIWSVWVLRLLSK